MGFKENLKDQLEFSGMYVKELAARSGVKKQTIDSYLNTHNARPSADSAVAIARALGVTVEYLITGQQNRVSVIGQYPLEVQKAAEIIAGLNKSNRRMALTIIKAIKKQEDEEKSRVKAVPGGLNAV